MKNSLKSGVNVPEIKLSAWDNQYLHMLADTSSKNEETQDVTKMTMAILDKHSLLQLREDVQALSHRSQGGGNYSQESVSHLACYLFIGSQFSQVKKYSQAILFNHDEKVVLQTMENIIIEFACSDEFEASMASLTTLYDLMRSFEYKIMAYLEMYHKLIEQSPIDDEQESGQRIKQYEAQADFLKVL